MATIQNKEHFEAAKAELEAKNAAFQATLPAEQQAKFAAVNKALADLREAGVECYLFPLLPIPEGKESVYTYNTIADLHYAQSESPTLEMKRRAFMTTVAAIRLLSPAFDEQDWQFVFRGQIEF